MIHELFHFLTATNGGEPIMAVAPLVIGAIMAAASALKSATFDQAKADRQRKLAAETTKYSPWTGMQAQPVQEADPMGAGIQGFGAGYGLGQNMENSAYQSQMANSGSPWSGVGLQGIGPVANSGAYQQALSRYNPNFGKLQNPF